MQALIICGSVARDAHTRTLLREFELNLREQDVDTEFWDLRIDPLPIADPAYHRAPHSHPDALVRHFVHAVDAADALALGSPLYHGSFSGVLKNALDHLGYDGFRNKAVALLSHGGGIRSCTQPCEQLRSVVRTLYGYSTQTQVATTMSDYERGLEGYELVNVEIRERLERLAIELVQLTDLFRLQEIAKED